MRHVAVAIKTTGPDPKEHRISELAAVQVKGGAGRQSLHLLISPTGMEGTSQGATFPEALANWTEFIRDATIVVHDYYELKRFLRAECARDEIGFGIKRDHPVIDTWMLAKERFPKQRHSLEAVTRKLGITWNLAASNALETAQTVSRVQVKLLNSEVVNSAPPDPGKAPAVLREAPSIGEAALTRPAPAQRSIAERLRLCWRVLVGHA